MTINEAIKELEDTLAYILEEKEPPALKTKEEVEESLSRGIESMRLGIEALKKMDAIKQIIENTSLIEEDVLRYKMICEVVGKE